jgi:hypothetical protein
VIIWKLITLSLKLDVVNTCTADVQRLRIGHQLPHSAPSLNYRDTDLCSCRGRVFVSSCHILTQMGN